MKEIELIGGPFDGAVVADNDVLVEGDHIVVEPDYSIKAFYVYQHGLFEFDSWLTYGQPLP